MNRPLDGQIANATVNRALHELVSCYGSAAELDLAAYDGSAGILGQSKRSLKSIANSKLGKTVQEASRNTHQQAGFSAEVIETTEINKRRVIKGDKVLNFPSDDLGKTNDQLVDTVDAVQMPDGTWKEIAGTGVQMKFIGKNGAEAFDKLCLDLFGLIGDDRGVDDRKTLRLRHGADGRAAGIHALPAGAFIADGNDCCRITHVSSFLS